MKYLNLSSSLGRTITGSILAIEVTEGAHPAIICPPSLEHKNIENMEYGPTFKITG